MYKEKMAELNLLWGSLILTELARLGVKHICMAPGSRSTPLTLAVANQDKLKQHLHFDERGLGFFALGLAKSSATPVAIITTSGTAVANLYPAIIEAWLTHVPLIVLSGDRPPELLDCGANQAIMQTGIFTHYAKAINLPTPDINLPPQALLTCLDQAISNQTQPVHINCMFREPLYPADISALTFDEYLASIKNWQSQSQPWLTISNSQTLALPSTEQIQDFIKGKGVIIAGTLTPEDDPQLILQLSQQLGWPLLTDAQCQLRQAAKAINHIDQLLLDKQAMAVLQQAENVLVFGGRLLSKRLIDYLAKQRWHAYWQVLPRQEKLDPSHSAKHLFISSINHFTQLNWCASVNVLWAEKLSQYNQQLETIFCQQIDQGEFGEAQVVRYIAQSSQTKLMIGNSLPVRLFDMFAPISNQASTTYTNRGASGIDGLLATACGIASDSKQATTLIIGDLSQLHDLNSLALAKQILSPLVIVILNNDGGNIFNLLPVPNEALRNQYYRLGHGLNFAGAAQMFELPYQNVRSLTEFDQAYQAALSHFGATIIEVSVDSQQASQQISAIRQLLQDN